MRSLIWLVVSLIIASMALCVYYGLFSPLDAPLIGMVSVLFLFSCTLLYFSSLHHPHAFTQKLSPALGVLFILFALSLPSLLLLGIGKKFPALLEYAPLWSGGLLIGGGVLSVYAFLKAHYPAVIKTHTLPIAKLQTPLKILQLSDLHIGGSYITPIILKKLISQSNALKADIIVLTGDIIDGPIEKIRANVALLGHLRAKYGIFYVTGNHEYFYDLTESLQFLRDLHILPLINENYILTLHSKPILNIAGIADLSAMPHPAPNLSKILSELNPSIPSLLLSHQPKIIHFLPSPSPFALILSGHTHGGQIFPFHALVLLQQPLIRGFKTYKNSLIYVNQGSGFWGIPMRLGSECEITLFELKPNYP